MDVGKAVSALNSQLRREILKVLFDDPSTVVEVLNNLRSKGFDIKYRETVYRALEKLVEAELVHKFYYSNKKRLCYKLSSAHIEIDISKNSIDITQ